jgi:hypothetical protein
MLPRALSSTKAALLPTESQLRGDVTGQLGDEANQILGYGRQAVPYGSSILGSDVSFIGTRDQILDQVGRVYDCLR